MYLRSDRGRSAVRAGEAPGGYSLAHTLMEGFVARFQVLAWRRADARAYGTLRAVSAAQGCTLGSMDLMIAAHAAATGAVLVTNDRALARVDGLRGTENWAADI